MRTDGILKLLSWPVRPKMMVFGNLERPAQPQEFPGNYRKIFGEWRMKTSPDGGGAQ
jgi:hypothetical protein